MFSKATISDLMQYAYCTNSSLIRKERFWAFIWYLVCQNRIADSVMAQHSSSTWKCQKYTCNSIHAQTVHFHVIPFLLLSRTHIYSVHACVKSKNGITWKCTICACIEWHVYFWHFHVLLECCDPILTNKIPVSNESSKSLFSDERWISTICILHQVWNGCFWKHVLLHVFFFPLPWQPATATYSSAQ